MSEGRPAEILIVDDNGINRKKLKFAVETLGYSAEVAADGVTGLEWLKSGRFDAVLLDLLMPEMDGFAVMEHVKADPTLRDIPIIVISDLEGEPESVSRAIELGAEDFLPKGFDPIILNARLKASLRKKEFRDQEIRYFQRVDTLTDAASLVESGEFDDDNLALLATEAQNDDPIGRLASVFQGMAKEIHAREVKLLERIRLLQGSLLLLLCAATASITPSLSRLAAGMDSQPLGLAVWVDIIAAAVCLGVTVLRGRFPKLAVSDVAFFAAWAFLVGILQHVTVFVLATHVEATFLTMVMALESLLVFLFAALLRLERAAPRRVVGLLVGLAGIGVALYDRLDGSGTTNTWLIAALVIPVIFAVETVAIAAKRPTHVDPVAALGLMFALSIVFAVPLAASFGQLMPASVLMSPLGFVILAIAVVSIIANASYIYLLDLAGAIFASQVAYATAIAGIFWGMLLLGERLSIPAWVAVGMVVLGMYLVETKGFDKPVKIKRVYR